MLDNILLILGSVFTAFIAILFILMNTSGAGGPYAFAVALLSFSGYALFVVGRYWDVA